MRTVVAVGIVQPLCADEGAVVVVMDENVAAKTVCSSSTARILYKMILVSYLHVIHYSK